MRPHPIFSITHWPMETEFYSLVCTDHPVKPNQTHKAMHDYDEHIYLTRRFPDWIMQRSDKFVVYVF